MSTTVGKLTSFEIEKIHKQIKGIEDTIVYLKDQRRRISQAILEDIPRNSELIRVPEQEITIDYGSIPIEFINAIRNSRLDRKMSVFYNVDFRNNIFISKEIQQFISEMYNTINHISTLIQISHPSRIYNRTLNDRIEDIMRNRMILSGNIPTIIENNIGWITKFKELRRIVGHKSPIEYNIRFQVRQPTTKAEFIMTNNFTSDEFDMFEIFTYLERLDSYSSEIKNEISRIISVVD